MSQPTDIIDLSVRDILTLYRARRLSPVEVLRAIVARAEAVDPALNALVGQRVEEAMLDARTAEVRWMNDAPLGALDGLPMTVKDSIAVSGMLYKRGSLSLLDAPPAAYDSPPAARLREAGAIIWSKTTMPDFGVLSSGVSSLYGITRNPWDLASSPGGSSSGGAAAVAARIGPATVGTDIGGSIRIPAAHCGLFALKPTRGRVPHLPTSLTRVAGPLSRDVTDSALIMSVLARPDSRDYFALPSEPFRYEDHLETEIAGVRLGLCTAAGFGPEPHPQIVAAVEHAAELFASAGAIVERIPRMLDFDPFGAIDLTFRLRALMEYDAMPKKQRDAVLPYIASWCEGARSKSALDMGDAQATIERAIAGWDRSSTRFDYVLTPTTPVLDFPAEALGPDPAAPLRHINFSALPNQTGAPAASIVCGLSERGMPIGLQIIGRRYDDLGVMQLAHAFEGIRDVALVWPELTGAAAAEQSQPQA